MSYPSIFNPLYTENPEPGMKVMVTPSSVFKLKIKYDDVDFNLYWHNHNGSDTKEAVRLNKCFRNLISIIQETEEFKQLPDANGGYD